MSVLIFANGELKSGEWIEAYLENASLIIAADGGLEHLLALELRPDVVIGDLDSASQDSLSAAAEAGATVLEHPTDKDETDLELALNYALEAHSGDIFVAGALGGRLDHTLANIQLLAHPRLANRRVTLVGARQRAWVVSKETQFSGRPGDTISLIPLGGDVVVATSSGLHWPLHDDVLRFAEARGVSNVLTGRLVTMTIKSGRLLCVYTESGGDR